MLNGAGLDRALAVGVKHLSISVSASETHSQKNTNRSVDEGRAKIKPVIEKALGEGIMVRAGIQSALGCGFEGHIDPDRVCEIARDFAAMGVQEINIADTAGLSNPRAVYELCCRLHDEIRADVNLSLHLHDTRGLGIANFVAGLHAGVRVFDAAAGGLGGCPFVPKATGNIATEDVAFACEEMGIETGINWQMLKAPVEQAEALLERTLPGRMAHMPPPPLGATLGGKVMRDYSLAYLTVPGVTPPEQVEIAAKAGFSHASFRLIHLGVAGEPEINPTDPAIISATKKAMQDTGIKCIDVELAKIHRDIEPESFVPAFEAGAELGASQVICSAWTDVRNDRGYIVEQFAHICSLAEPFGLTINLEFPAFSRLATLDECVEILELAGCPNQGLLVDTLYMHFNKCPLFALERVPSEWINFLHVC